MRTVNGIELDDGVDEPDAYDWRSSHESYHKHLYVDAPPKQVWDGEKWTNEKTMVMGCEAMTLFIPPDTDRQCSGTYVAHAHYAGRRIDSEASASPLDAVASLRKRLAAVMTPCSYTCTPDDHLRYADRGKCSLCGRQFNPPNEKTQATPASALRS